MVLEMKNVIFVWDWQFVTNAIWERLSDSAPLHDQPAFLLVRPPGPRQQTQRLIPWCGAALCMNPSEQLTLPLL